MSDSTAAEKQAADLGMRCAGMEYSHGPFGLYEFPLGYHRVCFVDAGLPVDMWWEVWLRIRRLVPATLAPGEDLRLARKREQLAQRIRTMVEARDEN